MSLISFSPLADGVTAVNAAATNTPLSTIYNDYNGNITDANIASNAAIAGTKIAPGAVRIKVGTLTITNAVTGNKATTGVGFTPKAVQFVQLTASSATINNVMQGGMDSSGNQFANGAHNDQGGDNSGNSSTSACILDFTTDRAIVHQAEYVSMDSDGFTIHVTTATGTQAYSYIAFG